MTEPARSADYVVDICPCGRPDHIALIYQLRDALGLATAAVPVPPKQVWEETLEYVRMMAGTGKYDDRGVCS